MRARRRAAYIDVPGEGEARLARLLALAGLCALAACKLPADVEGTSNRIHAERVVRVALIEDMAHPTVMAQADRFMDQVARATGARLDVRRGSLEPMLAEVEDGRLDMAVGEIAQDSPWQREMAIIEPIARRQDGKRVLGLSAMARNGENRWIMLLERQSRQYRDGR